MSERELQDAVIDLARLLGYRVAHFRPAQTKGGNWITAMSGDTGYPDLTLAGNGRVIFAELKSTKGKISDAQLDWRHALTSTGAEWYLWRPRDWTNGRIEAILRLRDADDAALGRLVRSA